MDEGGDADADSFIDRGASRKINIPTKGERLAADVEKLSPTTRGNLTSFVNKDLLPRKAWLKMDDQGKCRILNIDESGKEYKDLRNTNGVCVPRKETALKVNLKAVCDYAVYLEENHPPAVVVLDESKVTWEHGQYRELSEYVHLKDKQEKKVILGKGNSGCIFLIMDIKKRVLHAMKAVDLCSNSCSFRPEEILCWSDLNNSGDVPTLYMIRVEGNKMFLHMEVLDPAKTMRCIFQLMKPFKEDPKYGKIVKAFSLYFYKWALKFIRKMHKKGWVHQDVHDGNIMMKSDKTFKFLDFGQALRVCYDTLWDPRFLDKTTNDLDGLLLMFFRLFTGHIINVDDMKDYSNYIKEHIKQPNFTKDEIKMLEDMCWASKTTHLDIDEYIHTVQGHLDKALVNAGKPSDRILETMTGLLFPETFTDLNTEVGPQEDHIQDGQVSDKDHISLLKSELARRDETIQKLQQEVLDLKEEREEYVAEEDGQVFDKDRFSQLEAKLARQDETIQKLQQDNRDLQAKRDADVAKIQQLELELSRYRKAAKENGDLEARIQALAINGRGEQDELNSEKDDQDTSGYIGASATRSFQGDAKEDMEEKYGHLQTSETSLADRVPNLMAGHPVGAPSTETASSATSASTSSTPMSTGSAFSPPSRPSGARPKVSVHGRMTEGLAAMTFPGRFRMQGVLPMMPPQFPQMRPQGGGARPGAPGATTGSTQTGSSPRSGTEPPFDQMLRTTLSSAAAATTQAGNQSGSATSTQSTAGGQSTGAVNQSNSATPNQSTTGGNRPRSDDW